MPQKGPATPDRVIGKIRYVHEPTGYLCGQSVVAMLAGVPVEEVNGVMQTDRGTSMATIRAALDHYGIRHSRSRIRNTPGAVLPEICILSLQLPGYGHWSLYYRGTYYDPEFGVLTALPKGARLDYYWEISSG